MFHINYSIMRFFFKREQKKNKAFLENLKIKVAYVDDNTLTKMDQNIHHSIEANRKTWPILPSPVLARASEIIGEELHKRNLKTCDDIEEDI